MYVGSLFSGAGLGDLGLQRAGFQHRWFCEVDPYARRVLAARWPGVPIHGDVRGLHGQDLEHVDVLAGGFPCQDISAAGKGAGIVPGSRSGLWYEYLRLIRELRPGWVVLENVKTLLSRGMGTVLAGLASCGYDAEWDVLPAAAVGAPHLRERVVIVAYAHGVRHDESGPVLAPRGDLGHLRSVDAPVDWCGTRLDGPRAQAALSAHRGALVCRVDDGGAHALDQLRCLGNGIVPDVMEYVGRAILASL